MMDWHRYLRALALGLGLTFSLGLLSACAPILIGGAATTAAVAVDRRTTGEQVEDKAIDLKAGNETRLLLEDKPGRISVHSYAGRVLLTGDVPTAEDKDRAGQKVAEVDKVVQVINRLRVGEPTELNVRSNDTWITTKALSSLIKTKGVPTRTMSVTTERGVVYLQGRVTPEEGERAAKVVAGIPEVNEVVKLFEYISPEDLKEDGTIKDEFAEKSKTKSASEAQRIEPEALPVKN